jgi:CBS domain-containing protein
MRTKITAFPAEATIAELQAALERNMDSRGQRVYPVVGENKRLLGVMTRHDIMKILQDVRDGNELHVQLSDMIAAQSPVVAYPDEPLRLVVNRMAATGLTRFPVVNQDDGQELLGMIALPDLLKAREHSVQEEHLRERVLHLRVPPSLRWRSFTGTGKTANQAKPGETTTVEEPSTKES